MNSQNVFYLLADFFNMCVKEFCFPDCWKVLSVVPVFTIVGERSVAKNYPDICLLSVVRKILEKPFIKRLVDQLEKKEFFIYILNCYLAAPRRTLGHY